MLSNFKDKKLEIFLNFLYNIYRKRGKKMGLLKLLVNGCNDVKYAVGLIYYGGKK